MNYESFYSAMQQQEKSVQENLAAFQKLFKTLLRKVESGELKGLAQDLEAMEGISEGTKDMLAAMKDTAAGFDVKAYFESGEFAEQMVAACREKGVDVRGESPVYEMFPYRVRLDTENQEIYLDRKKVQCVRPRKFAEIVRTGQEKLNKAPFNAVNFVSELAEAYELAVLKQNKKSGVDIYLTSLYKLLAPMSRFRRDYDQQSFAFDLARLYQSGIEETKTGKKFQFGPSRNNNKAIRILDGEGQEQFLATIRFYD